MSDRADRSRKADAEFGDVKYSYLLQSPQRQYFKACLLHLSNSLPLLDSSVNETFCFSTDLAMSQARLKSQSFSKSSSSLCFRSNSCRMRSASFFKRSFLVALSSSAVPDVVDTTTLVGGVAESDGSILSSSTPG